MVSHLRCLLFKRQSRLSLVIAKQTGKPRTVPARGCVLIRIGGSYRTHNAVSGVKAKRVLIRMGGLHRTQTAVSSVRMVRYW